METKPLEGAPAELTFKILSKEEHQLDKDHPNYNPQKTPTMR